MTIDLEVLRRRSNELAETGDYESEEVVEINRALFEADPANRAVGNRLGFALMCRGELDGAVEVLTQVLRANPGDPVASERLARVESRLAEQPAREANEVVESALESQGPADRAASLSFMEDSIRAIQQIDADYLAVTESPSTGFRIWAGAVTVCAPADEQISVRMNEVGARGLIERIRWMGGKLQRGWHAPLFLTASG